MFMTDFWRAFKQDNNFFISMTLNNTRQWLFLLCRPISIVVIASQQGDRSLEVDIPRMRINIPDRKSFFGDTTEYTL